MRKLLKFMLLILVFVMSTGIFAAASERVDVSPDEALGLLRNLDIILTKDKTEDFSEDKAVTKGDFSIYLVRALKMETYTGTSLPFSDINSNDAIAPYIRALYERGVVHGYNSEFNVNKTISYNEAVKMMVSAVGYGQMAELSGGYPKGYLSVAYNLDILKNVNIQNHESITKKEAAIMLFNMLNSEYLESKDSVNYESSGQTLFSKLYNIHSSKGRVVRNSDVSLIANNSPERIGYVQIGNEIFREGKTDVSSYLGYEIEFYYQYDEKLEDGEIILITELDERQKEIYIEAEDILGFSNNQYTYVDENGKTKNVHLAGEYYLSYNMAYPSSGFTKEKMKPAYGGVRIIWGSKSGQPDVVMIDEYTSYAVNSVDESKKIVYCKNKKKLNLSSVKYKVIDNSGKEVELSAIKEWNVISEAWNSNGSEVVIYISDNSISQTITSMGNENGQNYIVLGDDKYIVNDDCYNNSKINVNIFVTAYLDILGRVAAVDVEENKGMKFAYFLRAFINEDDEKGYVKLYDETGNLQIYQLHEKIKINDVRCTSVSNAVEYLRNLTENIVKFETNAQNVVISMIVSDGTDKYIHKVSVIQKIWNSNNKTFGGQATFNDNAPVFVIPGDDESKFKIDSIKSFAHDTGYGDVEIYTTGDNIFAEVIIRGDAAQNFQRNCAVVQSVRDVLNAEGEVTKGVTILYNGIVSEYELTTDMTETLGAGDILQFGFDTDGRIANINKLYDGESDTMLVSNPYEPQSGAGYRSARRAYLGYVYIKDKGLIKFGPQVPTNENFKTAYTENALLSGFNIYVIDMSERGKDRVYIGNENDIIDFYHSGSDYSKVMVLTMWNDPEDLVIIK